MKTMLRLWQISIVMLITATSLQAQSITNDQYISKEKNCLALNIYFEARSESMEGQFAVAAVTMNRVLSNRYPNGVCAVVWQRRQFSWTHDGKSDRPTEIKAWAIAQQLAELVYTKYPHIQRRTNGAWDLTRGALHYYAPKLASPAWANQNKTSIQIGSHLFLSLKTS